MCLMHAWEHQRLFLRREHLLHVKQHIIKWVLLFNVILWSKLHLWPSIHFYPFDTFQPLVNLKTMWMFMFFAEFEPQKHCEISWILKDKDSSSHSSWVSEIKISLPLTWNICLKNFVIHWFSWFRYVENGSLANIIKPNKFGPFPESLVAVYIAQVG